MKKKVIALIPARAGSKGIKNKNTKLLLGKPLLAWTIKTCLKSKYIDNNVINEVGSNEYLLKKYGPK